MKSKLKLTMLVMVLVGLLLASGALAQTALPAPNAAFDMTGFIQAATVAQVGATAVNPRLRGGTLTINGIQMIVPNNSIVQMPAAGFTWADLFNPATSASVGYPAPRLGHGGAILGLALQDPINLHFPSYEVRAVGNIITNQVTGAQQYIVGMILPVVQQGLNGGAGYINFIDYDGSVLGGVPGRFRVGGIMGNSATGTLCELNDPVGRFGHAHSPDPRFQVDWNNPTVSTATGYPVGIPNVAPVLGVNGFPVPGQLGDPDRPYYNRPENGGAFGTDAFLPLGAPLKFFTMPAAGAPNGGGVTTPDPWKQVPLMVGDWVDYSGTLMKIAQAGVNTPANAFMSIHTLTAHLGVKTTPGTQPAYIRVEEFLFGVGDRNGGPTVAGIAQETSTRVVMVSFTTDSDATGANLPGGAIFGIDPNPATGVESELQFPNGSTALNPVDFNVDDPVRGRLRWQTSNNGSTPGVLANAVGARKFYREYIVKLTGPGRGQVQLPDQAQLQPDGSPLPGLIAGQYRLPVFDYLFGEGTNFGEPVPPFNFEDFGFLNVGSGRLNGPNSGPVIGRLDPFPASQ